MISSEWQTLFIRAKCQLKSEFSIVFLTQGSPHWGVLNCNSWLSKMAPWQRAIDDRSYYFTTIWWMTACRRQCEDSLGRSYPTAPSIFFFRGYLYWYRRTKFKPGMSTISYTQLTFHIFQPKSYIFQHKLGITWDPKNA